MRWTSSRRTRACTQWRSPSGRARSRGLPSLRGQPALDGLLELDLAGERLAHRARARGRPQPLDALVREVVSQAHVHPEAFRVRMRVVVDLDLHGPDVPLAVPGIHLDRGGRAG